MPDRHSFALLLSGGGARAAYQVGVLKAIATLLPRNHALPFPILCGNSAGAINVTALACYASCYHLGVRRLEWVWKNFHSNQIYLSSISGVFGYLLKGYLHRLIADYPGKPASSLLDNQPLRALINKTMDFHRIDRNLMRGYLRALCITASSYTHHESISYFQGQPDLKPWQRHQRSGRACVLDTDYLMASSAIPLIFPPVRINGEYLGDGSVHQLSPLSPPIHLGADKILVIGVEQPEMKKSLSNSKIFPSNLAIAGHLLDTIFADSLHTDIERMQRVNQTLSIFTPKQRNATHLKPIDCLMVNPSKNFDEVANRYFHHMPAGIKALLRLLGLRNSNDAGFLSYLLFEKGFCQELIQLGWQDGMAKRDEIKTFLQL